MSSSDLNFDKIKHVNGRTESLISGYIHEYEKKFSVIVPELVVFYCILFYHQFEFFTAHGTNITISDHLTTATFNNKTRCTHTVYGNAEIKKSLNAILIWTIKIVKIGSGVVDGDCEDLYLGIDSSNKDNIKSDFCGMSSSIYYAFGTDHARWTNAPYTYDKPLEELEPDFDRYEIYGEYLKDGDVVKMEVNTDKEYLKYFINDEDFGIAYQNIFTMGAAHFECFHFAAAMRNKGTSIQILDFEIRPPK